MAMWLLILMIFIGALIFILPERNRNSLKRKKQIAAGKAVIADWTKPVEQIVWQDELKATVYFANKDFPAELMSAAIPKSGPLFIASMRFSTHLPMVLLLTDKEPRFFDKFLNKKTYMPWPAPITHPAF